MPSVDWALCARGIPSVSERLSCACDLHGPLQPNLFRLPFLQTIRTPAERGVCWRQPFGDGVLDREHELVDRIEGRRALLDGLNRESAEEVEAEAGSEGEERDPLAERGARRAVHAGSAGVNIVCKGVTASSPSVEEIKEAFKFGASDAFQGNRLAFPGAKVPEGTCKQLLEVNRVPGEEVPMDFKFLVLDLEAEN